MPAATQIVQTYGNLLNTNPHIHCIAADGLFKANGTFIKMPKYSETAHRAIQTLFESKVADYCLARGFVRPETIQKRLTWQYSGFSVYIDTQIDYTKYNEQEKEKMDSIVRYIAKPFYSMERVTYNEAGSTVLYKGEFNKSIKQNFETFSPNDFIAALTAHIPERHQKYTNFYGYYSNKSRGLRAKAGVPEIEENVSIMPDPPREEQKKYRKNWAILIKKVWEVDPLLCPSCGATMKMIAVIDKAEVIEKILTHIGLWVEDERGPPAEIKQAEYGEVIREAFLDDWAVNERAVKYA